MARSRRPGDDRRATYAVPASKCDASTVGIHAFGLSPGTFTNTLLHVCRRFASTCTLPSSVPTQITFESSRRRRNRQQRAMKLGGGVVDDDRTAGALLFSRDRSS